MSKPSKNAKSPQTLRAIPCEQLLKAVGELSKPEVVTFPVDIALTGYLWVTIGIAAERMGMTLGEYIMENFDMDKCLDDGVNGFTTLPGRKGRKGAK